MNATDWIDARDPVRKQFQHSFDHFSESYGVNEEYLATLIDAPIVDYYKIFVSSNIIDLIVEQTNLYATQIVLTKDTTPSSRIHFWNPVDRDEIWIFLGILMYMGVVRLPKIEDYWSTDTLFKNDVIPKVMSRNRFQLILRFIHFADNDDPNQTDKLHKIGMLSEMLLENFKAVYTPGPVLTIDESMIPFRGRLKFRQYNKQKTHSYGIKVFKICSTLGYTHKFIVYSGKIASERNVRVSEKVVLDLIKDYNNVGRTVVTDNWFTSLTLAEKLLQQKTHLVGTLRQNRKGIPNSLFQVKLNKTDGSTLKMKNKKLEKIQKGDTVAMRNKSGVTIVHYKDKRSVLLLSTRHTLEMVEITKKYKTVVKPDSIHFYNRKKIGVDISDQMASYNDVLRKSMKWYRKLAFEMLLHMAVTNSWIVYQEVCGKTVSILEFRENLIKGLLKITPEVEEVSRPRASIHKLHQVEGTRYSNRRQCRGCYQTLSKKFGTQYARNRAKKVVTYCPECPNEPFYCLNCFNKNHK